jgi:hypothetical protein
MKKIVVALLAVLFAFGSMSMTGCKVKKKKYKGGGGGKSGFCKDMTNRYTKCMTGNKKGFSADYKHRLIKECKKNKHTRKALMKCEKHDDCEKFEECLRDKL